MRTLSFMILLALSGICQAAFADQTTAEPRSDADAALAKQLGGNENGMRSYVLVILKTGAHRVPDGKARDDMFKGHFANIQRLADEGKLVVAGPFSKDKDEWRGMFIFAVDSIEAAKLLVDTDPVITNGEMVAEYHSLYSSAALMLVNETHKRISKK